MQPLIYFQSVCTLLAVFSYRYNLQLPFLVFVVGFLTLSYKWNNLGIYLMAEYGLNYILNISWNLPGRLISADTPNKYRYIFGNIDKKNYIHYISTPSFRIRISIGENRMKICAILFEFIASRQTDAADFVLLMCSDTLFLTLLIIYYKPFNS